MNTESNRVEFKHELTDKFERSVVAFLKSSRKGQAEYSNKNDTLTIMN